MLAAGGVEESPTTMKRASELAEPHKVEKVVGALAIGLSTSLTDAELMASADIKSALQAAVATGSGFSLEDVTIDSISASTPSAAAAAFLASPGLSLRQVQLPDDSAAYDQVPRLRFENSRLRFQEQERDSRRRKAAVINSGPVSRVAPDHREADGEAFSRPSRAGSRGTTKPDALARGTPPRLGEAILIAGTGEIVGDTVANKNDNQNRAQRGRGAATALDPMQSRNWLPSSSSSVAESDRVQMSSKMPRSSTKKTAKALSVQYTIAVNNIDDSQASAALANMTNNVGAYSASVAGAVQSNLQAKGLNVTSTAVPEPQVEEVVVVPSVEETALQVEDLCMTAGFEVSLVLDDANDTLEDCIGYGSALGNPVGYAILEKYDALAGEQAALVGTNFTDSLTTNLTLAVVPLPGEASQQSTSSSLLEEAAAASSSSFTQLTTRVMRRESADGTTTAGPAALLVNYTLKWSEANAQSNPGLATILMAFTQDPAFSEALGEKILTVVDDADLPLAAVDFQFLGASTGTEVKATDSRGPEMPEDADEIDSDTEEEDGQANRPDLQIGYAARSESTERNLVAAGLFVALLLVLCSWTRSCSSDTDPKGELM
ncbi:unnamed protein product [Amoebophrya sp. A120]|nr:unnamed protein product [Amoebophrya sp. A120]|eukprot:GSA120T00023981001.1